MPEYDVIDLYYMAGSLTLLITIPLLMMFFWKPEQHNRDV